MPAECGQYDPKQAAIQCSVTGMFVAAVLTQMAHMYTLWALAGPVSTAAGSSLYVCEYTGNKDTHSHCKTSPVHRCHYHWQQYILTNITKNRPAYAPNVYAPKKQSTAASTSSTNL